MSKRKTKGNWKAMPSAARRRRRRALIRRDGARCAECGATERLTMDHVIPQCEGGSHRLDNLQLLCEPCQREKARVEGERAKARRLAA